MSCALASTGIPVDTPAVIASVTTPTRLATVVYDPVSARYVAPRTCAICFVVIVNDPGPAVVNANGVPDPLVAVILNCVELTISKT